MAKPEAVFIYIGTYPSETAARDDYNVVKDLHSAGAIGTYDAAVVTKDDAGKIHVNKDEMATRHGASGSAPGTSAPSSSILCPPSDTSAPQLVGAGRRRGRAAHLRGVGMTLPSL